jgi:hypothetical protein
LLQEDNPAGSAQRKEAEVEFEAADGSTIGYAESIAKTLLDRSMT